LSVQTGNLSSDFDENFATFQLFYLTGKVEWVTGFQYVYSWQGGEPLRYARYVLITPVRDEEKELPQDKILKIESHVLFKKGALTGENVMESFIGDYEI
jgi:hypothetical protein